MGALRSIDDRQMNTNSEIWLVFCAARIFPSLPTGTVTLSLIIEFEFEFFNWFESAKKIEKLFAGLRSVSIVKNCDAGLGQYFQDRGHSFLPYGPPSRQITYNYFIISRTTIEQGWTNGQDASNMHVLKAEIFQFPCGKVVWSPTASWNHHFHFSNLVEKHPQIIEIRLVDSVIWPANVYMALVIH